MNNRREKLNALLEREGYSRYMNDTRWMALIDAIHGLHGLRLRYRLKPITDTEVSEWVMGFPVIPHPYIEITSLGPLLALEVEWLEIDAIGPWLSSSKEWIPKELTDYSDEVAEMFNGVRVPYEQDGTLFRVIGHKKRGG